MRVKIIKCSKDVYWYKNYIGRCFDVNFIEYLGNEYYEIYNSTHYDNMCLEISDCIDPKKLRELKLKNIL